MGNGSSEPTPAPPPAPPKTTTTRAPKTPGRRPTMPTTTTEPHVQKTTFDPTTSSAWNSPAGKGDRNSLAGGGGGGDGSTGAVGYIAITGGILCVVIAVILLGVYVWRRNRSKTSTEGHSTAMDPELPNTRSNGNLPPNGNRIPSFVADDDEGDENLSLYTQVNKEKKNKQGTNGDNNTSTILEVPIASDDPQTTGQDRAADDRQVGELKIKGDAVSYYNVWSDTKTVVIDGKPTTIAPDNPNDRAPNANGRVTYENCEPTVTSEEVAYEVHSDYKPEAPVPDPEASSEFGNTYDKLDRPDRAIANGTIFGENEYDM